jgi:tetratricopeptide (TPR) repeat protein
MNPTPLGERYVDLGVKAIDQDDLEKALRYLNRALSLDSNSYLAYYNRAVAYDMLERLEEALADYDRALAIQPNHLASQHNRAVLLAARDHSRPSRLKRCCARPDNGTKPTTAIAHADPVGDDAWRRERAIAPIRADARIAKGNAFRAGGSKRPDVAQDVSRTSNR